MGNQSDEITSMYIKKDILAPKTSRNLSKQQTGDNNKARLFPKDTFHKMAEEDMQEEYEERKKNIKKKYNVELDPVEESLDSFE